MTFAPSGAPGAPAPPAPPAPGRVLASLQSSEELRLVADRALSRAAGAPLVSGNRVDLLLDAGENYPAWKRALASATHTIHVEMYIFGDDALGNEFADLLIDKARDGVRVRLLYDWLGGFKTPARFWDRLRAGGVEVRCCNPPQLGDPLQMIRRDHRKAIVVDGELAFVSGLCIAKPWVGEPERGLAPWRDTGVAIRGPAVADVAEAFASVWALAGEPLPDEELPVRDRIGKAGEQMLRVIATEPDVGGLFGLDLLWASIARDRLWLADAYFVGTPLYLRALTSAAQAGVDVRLLVPSASDIELVARFSRTQYRSLLDGGIRVFEWNGSMMHAKTAVVDGHWSRVGSTNLNLASWIGNWELDVCVEDDEFARAMEQSYEEDLANATEIVHRPGHPVESSRDRAASGAPFGSSRGIAPGSASRAAAAALQLGRAVSAAFTQRSVAFVEAPALQSFGLTLLAVALVAFFLPRVVAVPFGVAVGWIGIALVLRAGLLRRRALREDP